MWPIQAEPRTRRITNRKIFRKRRDDVLGSGRNWLLQRVDRHEPAYDRIYLQLTLIFKKMGQRGRLIMTLATDSVTCIFTSHANPVSYQSHANPVSYQSQTPPPCQSSFLSVALSRVISKVSNFNFNK